MSQSKIMHHFTYLNN